MSKAVWGPIAATALIALTLLNTYFILHGKDENGQRAKENHTLAEETHTLAVQNCIDNGALAKIERAFINRQEAQTQSLFASGVTFGIPAEKIPALLQASRDSQALFLHELDALAVTSCSSPNPAVAPIVPPGHKKPRAKPKRKASLPSSPLAVLRAGITSAARTQQPSSVPSPRRRGTQPTVSTPRRAPQLAPERAAERAAAPPAAPPTASAPPAPSAPSAPPVLPVPAGPVLTVPLPCLQTPLLRVC